jgi:ABC-type transport system involved in multi-copper enzyme maturation permease subunit
MALLRSQLFKIRRQALPRAIALVLLGLALLRGLVWPPEPGLPWSGLWSFQLVAAALIILTAITVWQELAGGNFRALVSRGVPRWQWLASHFAVLALVGGVLLAGTEGLATLLGVRPGLRWGELFRAWLSLWPYAALVMLWAVIARNGGLALIVGILQLGLEHFHGILMGPLALMPEAIPKAWRVLTHLGLSGALYQWSLSYNSANWTYLGEWQRAPAMTNALIYALPNPAVRSALILAAYTAGALGLAAYILYRRDVTEVVTGRTRLWGLTARARRRRWTPRTSASAPRLPPGTGRGPLVVRLARAHLFVVGRTSLVKVGVGVSLFFALVMWGVSRLTVASGFGDILFGTGAGGERPLAFVVSLLVVGPLATVLGVLAISNGLVLGIRRGELSRGVLRAQAIVGQSVALVTVLGGVLALMLAATVLAGASASGTWYLLPAGAALATGLLAAVAYLGPIQAGGALARSGIGAMLFGLGFLVVDWLCLMVPAVVGGDPGFLPDLARYSVAMCTLSVAAGGAIRDPGFGWRFLEPGLAALLLVTYGLMGHVLAITIARRRDA